jgi:transcriptional regulator with XRE-family HTH domain
MITQEQIAEKTGLLQTNISRIFLLKYRPRIDTFVSICDAVGVNFFIEDKSGKSELNILFEKAMSKLGRHPSDFPKN